MGYNIDQLIEKLKVTKTIFFDLDGTLIDTEKLYFRFWKEGASFYGYEMSDEEALNMRSINPKSGEEYLTKISNGKLDYHKVKAKRIELMTEYLSTHPIEMKLGAMEFLTLLAKEHKKIYIVTANAVEKAESIIKEVGFRHLVDGVISAKEVARGKPFPDVYLKACEIVNEKPRDVIVFEDSPNGLKSSYDAGCYTVMVEDLTPFNENMDYVDASISSLLELNIVYTYTRIHNK
ncbi:MAG: HAD family phosphatase [Bacilli bacterium]|nr:HAD family phosphatase [Bacilli bacterium]